MPVRKDQSYNQGKRQMSDERSSDVVMTDRYKGKSKMSGIIRHGCVTLKCMRRLDKESLFVF